MKISFCTLFERNYHFGVAALSNSLIAAGYAGTLWVGYRGALSGWIVDSPSFNRATGTGYYLSHAIGSVKPWHGGHIRQALHGSPPSFASKWYSRFANAPIRVYLDGALAKRQLSLKIAAAIGRVCKRA